MMFEVYGFLLLLASAMTGLAFKIFATTESLEKVKTYVNANFVTKPELQALEQKIDKGMEKMDDIRTILLLRGVNKDGN